jgi:hypothetical protein
MCATVATFIGAAPVFSISNAPGPATVIATRPRTVGLAVTVALAEGAGVSTRAGWTSA